MFGKMSVGVRTAAATPKMTINIAITTNVYGLFKAIRTMESIGLFGSDWLRAFNGRRKGAVRPGLPTYMPTPESLASGRH